MKFRRIALLLIGISLNLRAGNSEVSDIVRDANGNLLAVGLANDIDTGTTDFALARYLPDGTLDTTFNPFGDLPGTLQLGIAEGMDAFDAPILTPTDEGLVSVALTSNNEIIGAGFSMVGLESSVAVLKLNEDGSLDQTFNALGNFGVTPGLAIISISSFPGLTSPTDVMNALASDVAIDSQGRIIVVGTADNGENLSIFVLRLTSNGELDRTFNFESATPGLFLFSLINADNAQDDLSASAVALTPDDGILIGGDIVNNGTSAADTGSNFIIVKVMPTGVLDITFNAEMLSPGAPGYVTRNFLSVGDEAFDLVIDSQQRILIGGFASQFNAGGATNTGGAQTLFALARYNADGSIDTTFNGLGQQLGVPGTVLTSISNNLDSILGLAITADNKILATGYTNDGVNQSFATIRYLDDGSFDPTFNPTGLNGPRPGIVVTTVVPPQVQDEAINPLNAALAVVIGANSQLYISGFSFDGLQNNFTTINYLATGDLNPTFNTLGLISVRPGIVITPFGQSLRTLGNGVPLIVTENLRGVSSQIIDRLEYPPKPLVPSIITDVSRNFATSRPVLAGQATPNASIALYSGDKDSPIAVTTANKNGKWDVTLPSLADGTYTISAVSLDPLTGMSLSSETVAVRILAEPPSAPIIETPVNEEIFSKGEVPIISGKAEPGMLVTISLDDRELELVASESGHWSVDVENLPEGTHKVSAQAATPSGITGPDSESVTFSVQEEQEEDEQAPRILTPQSGIFASTSVALTGEGTPNSKVKLFVNNTALTDVQVDTAGRWSYTLRDLKGSNEIYVAAAPDGPASEKITIRNAGKAVAAKTKQAQIAQQTDLLHGKAVPGSHIELYVNNKRIGSTIVSSEGTWGYTPTEDVRLKGEYPVQVMITGPQGQGSVMVQRVKF